MTDASDNRHPLASYEKMLEDGHMVLPSHRTVVKPSWRKSGVSWGLEYPLVYGSLIFGCWAVWDRHTGIVYAFFPDDLSIHGYNFAKDRAEQFSMPVTYKQSPFVYDDIA